MQSEVFCRRDVLRKIVNRVQGFIKPHLDLKLNTLVGEGGINTRMLNMHGVSNMKMGPSFVPDAYMMWATDGKGLYAEQVSKSEPPSSVTQCVMPFEEWDALVKAEKRAQVQIRIPHVDGRQPHLRRALDQIQSGYEAPHWWLRFVRSLEVAAAIRSLPPWTYESNVLSQSGPNKGKLIEKQYPSDMVGIAALSGLGEVGNVVVCSGGEVRHVEGSFDTDPLGKWSGSVFPPGIAVLFNRTHLLTLLDAAGRLNKLARCCTSVQGRFAKTGSRYVPRNFIDAEASQWESCLWGETMGTGFLMTMPLEQEAAQDETGRVLVELAKAKGITIHP